MIYDSVNAFIFPKCDGKSELPNCSFTRTSQCSIFQTFDRKTILWVEIVMKLSTGSYSSSREQSSFRNNVHAT